jgi:hypothetical protein
VLALGDHRDRAVAVHREARTLAAAPRELGEAGLRDPGELLGRPGAAGELERLGGKLVGARFRVLAQIAETDQRLQQVVRGAAKHLRTETGVGYRLVADDP